MRKVRRSFRTCALALVLAFAAVVPAWADFEAGQRAWDAGRPAEAVAAWQSAAAAGDGRAMLALGRAYAKGRGVLQDFVEAHMWLNLASGLGSAEAEAERDALAKEMTAEERAEARKVARAWRNRGAQAGVRQTAREAPAAEAPARPASDGASPLSPSPRDANKPAPIDVAADLHNSAFSISRDRVLNWLQEGGDPNLVLDGIGDTFMHLAAANLPVLLAEGIAHGGDCRRENANRATPLHFAAAQGDLGPGPESVRLLLQCGGRPDAAARPNAKDRRGDTPLHAVYAGVETFGGALVRNVDNVTAGKGFDILATLLSEAKADPNIGNAEGDTPVMLLIRDRGALIPAKTKHLSLLLRHGADPDARNGKGETPLFEALSLPPSKKYYPDAKEVIEILLGGGADPDIRDGIGDTPLIRAAKHEEDRALDIEALLAGGADPCLRDRAGKLAWDYTAAKSEGRLLLRKAGGYVDRTTGLCARELEEAKQAEAKLGLDRDRRRRVQSCLARLDFDPGSPDGALGPRSRAAIRNWQAAQGAEGVAAAGYLDADSLDTLFAACKTTFNPECTGNPADTPKGCWMQAQGRSDCWIWNPYPQPQETVSWDGRCMDGLLSGKGKLVWRFREDGRAASSWQEGLYKDGEMHGHFVNRHSSGEVWEGRYVKGKRDSLWVRRDAGQNLDALCYRWGEKVDLGNCLKEADEPAGRVLKGAAALRHGPGKDFSRMGASFPEGLKVVVTHTSGRWARVEAGGRAGFVSTAMLAEARPEPEVAAVVTEPKCRFIFDIYVDRFSETEKNGYKVGNLDHAARVAYMERMSETYVRHLRKSEIRFSEDGIDRDITVEQFERKTGTNIEMCWRELDNIRGCYVYFGAYFPILGGPRKAKMISSSHHYPGNRGPLMVEWDGQCKDGVVEGVGKIKLKYFGRAPYEEEQIYDQGKRHEQYHQESEYDDCVYEGQYEQGLKEGKWVVHSCPNWNKNGIKIYKKGIPVECTGRFFDSSYPNSCLPWGGI